MWGRRLPEGRGENLLSTSALPADLRRAARRFWIALLFLLLLMAFAAAIYVNVESRISGAPWTIIDAVYMAVITIATIGFMEVHPLSQFGRAFTTGFAITGIILAAVAVRSAASLLLGEQLSHEFERRRRVRALRYVRDHYIVCGYGRMGREAVTQLRRRGLSVVVIEHEADGLDRLREGGILYVEGNATQDESLKSAGVERAKVLIAAVATDEDNLFVVLSARLLNPSLYIIARAGQEGAVDKLTHRREPRALSIRGRRPEPRCCRGRAGSGRLPGDGAAPGRPGRRDHLAPDLFRRARCRDIPGGCRADAGGQCNDPRDCGRRREFPYQSASRQCAPPRRSADRHGVASTAHRSPATDTLNRTPEARNERRPLLADAVSSRTTHFRFHGGVSGRSASNSSISFFSYPPA